MDRDGERLTLHPRSWCWPPACPPGKPQCADLAGPGHLPPASSIIPAAPGPDKYVGKRAVVIGSNNSAHDICKALYENGVTHEMIQRSSTHIVKSNSLMDLGLGDAVLRACVGVGDDDREGRPDVRVVALRIMHEFQIPTTTRSANATRSTTRDWPTPDSTWTSAKNDSGLFMKYLRRGSGYYIDVGALRSGGERIDQAGARSGRSRLTEDSVVLSRRDGRFRPPTWWCTRPATAR